MRPIEVTNTGMSVALPKELFQEILQSFLSGNSFLLNKGNNTETEAFIHYDDAISDIGDIVGAYVTGEQIVFETTKDALPFTYAEYFTPRIRVKKNTFEPITIKLKDKMVQMEVKVERSFLDEIVFQFLIGKIHFTVNVADKDCEIFVNEDSKPYSVFDLIDAVHQELGGYEKTTKFSLIGM